MALCPIHVEYRLHYQSKVSMLDKLLIYVGHHKK